MALMVGRNVNDLFPTVPHTPGEEILSLASAQRRQIAARCQLRTSAAARFWASPGWSAPDARSCCAAFSASIRSARGAVRVAAYSPRATPRARIRAGLGLVSEDRKGEGLAQERSIADNLTLSRLQPYSRWGWLSLRRRERGRARLDGPTRDQGRRRRSATVKELSGGNQQKVALARVLHQAGRRAAAWTSRRGASTSAPRPRSIAAWGNSPPRANR